MRNATWFSMFCAVGLTSGLVACGDDTTSGTTTGTTTTTTTATTTTTSSGMGGAGGDGGAGGASNLLNGCDADGADAVDRTADPALTIVNVGSTSYDPRCVKVAVGTDITFNVNFAIHPLVGGEIVAGAPTPDPESDIPNTTTGDTVTFALDTAGVFPYYCNVHAPGMAGVIFVE
jgi:plastocyanin